MKCPACVEAGMRSRLDVHPLSKTPAPVERFYDEDGRLHVHDHTDYGTVFTCSNEHGYVEGGQSPCPQKDCDWNKRPEVIARDRPLGANAP